MRVAKPNYNYKRPRGWLNFFNIILIVCYTLVVNSYADTGDVIDDTLAVNTGVWICAGNAVVTWADIDENGEYDTQVVFTTQTGVGGDAGEAQISRDDPDGKWYFFSFENGHCGGVVPGTGRGRFTIHFVDILAPGFVWNDPASWLYKTVPAASMRISNDGCFGYTDPRYDGDYLPYQKVQAYAERNQVDSISPYDEVILERRKNYRFSHADGIKELYISTDFCENVLDDLVLYSDVLSDHIVGDRAGLVLLFDTSGSMNWSHQGILGVPESEQRLTLAKEAAIPIIHLMNEHTTGDVDFAIARFPLQPYVAGVCNAETISAMAIADDTNTTGAIDTDIANLSAAGKTPLLTGIASALTTFADQDRRALVLLSDGYHNCPERVDVADIQVTNVISQALGAQTSIYSIGFGRPSDVDHPLLDRLATETSGSFFDVTEAGFDAATWTPQIALQEAYVSILSNALLLDLESDPRGTISASEQKDHNVYIHQKDETVSFYLGWSTRQENRLNMRLYNSNAEVVDESALGVSVQQGNNFKIITLKPEYLNRPNVVSNEPFKLNIQAEDLATDTVENYQYSVLVSSPVKMHAQILENQTTTGQPITLSAQLTDSGTPITNMDKVEVEVHRPEDGLGNWFAANPVSESELAQIPTNIGDETLSPASRKYRFLRDIKKLEPPKRIPVTTVTLFDDGSNGDEQANDGIYTNRFNETSKAGIYTFVFTAEGDLSSDYLRRQARIDRNVSVNVVETETEVKTILLDTQTAGVSRFEIRVTPKDTLGNFLGSNYSAAIKIDSEWLKTVTDIIDNLDGSYSQVVEIPREVADGANISVSIGGEQISVILQHSDVDQIYTVPWWILVLLIIVIFYIVRWRRRTVG